MSARIEVEHLTVDYGGFQVIEDLSLQFEPGGIVGLIGPNGAGKSTLLSVISGFLPAVRGQVRFGGERMTHLAPDARARKGLVRTFQVPREFTHLTVLENMLAAAPAQSGESLGAALLRRGRVRDEDTVLRERAAEWLAFLRLDGVAAQPAGRLSGGQKKLLELGRLLMLQPRCILLDEPFAGVNPVLIGQIAERLRELSARGIGLVIVEHHLQMLARLAGSLVVLDRGRLLASGPPAQVLSDPAVQAAYMGT